MKYIAIVSILASLVFSLSCTDAYNDIVCQFTIITTAINNRTDSVKIEIPGIDVDTIAPNEDMVYIWDDTKWCIDNCEEPEAVDMIQYVRVRSSETGEFDSLIQVDTIASLFEWITVKHVLTYQVSVEIPIQ